MKTRKYWMLDPQLFNADSDGRAFVPVVLEPKDYYDYESDPEYIQIEVPEWSGAVSEGRGTE